MRQELTEILEELLTTLEVSKNSNPYLDPMLIPNWTKTDIGVKYYNLFKEYFKLEDDDYIYQNQGGGACLTDTEQLVDFSIVLGNKNGSEKSLIQITEYLNSKEIIAYELMLLQSVNIECEFEFINGVKLLLPKSIPNKFIAESLKKRHNYGYVPDPHIMCALIVEGRQSKFTGKREGSHGFDNEKIPVEPLDDALLCLSLVRPTEFGIQAYAIGLICDEELPFWRPHQRWRMLPYKRPTPYSPEITKNELESSNELLKKFIQLPKGLRKKLTISMEKLNEFGSGLSIVERAINLRICLESIFLNDGNKEQLRFTLSLRGSLFLGTTFEERELIFKTFKKTYDLTSTAVHSGILKDENNSHLILASEYAKDAIIKMINIGKTINWTEIELGK
ncbi:hypothetical protein [Tenacibaculum ovolyticum]|uniref:hypothetical protein n=1 Tax=Tenacibaculum ovolyticum TaxID=104270 RepID=UPI001F3A6ADD|nr:hypothetical protein [Tenacibaculum ovolyticum]